jgi:transcriptional regulator with GAF, ATPase, and Fis domain
MQTVIAARNAFYERQQPAADDTPLTVTDRLTAELSSALMRLRPNESEGLIDGALRRIADALNLDRVRLLQYADDGISVARLRSVGRAGAPAAGTDAAALPWYATRFESCEPIVLNRLPDDLPPDARPERAPHSSAPAMRSQVILPVEVDGRRVCALDAATFGTYRTWAPPTVQRLRLVAEIIGAALYRARQTQALLELSRAHAAQAMPNETAYLRQELDSLRGFDDIVGESPSLRASLAQVVEVAPTDATVLLLGETGTGKDLFARALHQRSRRSGRPLISVNCAALPASLIESELFGHERGAFTGAVSQRQGRFELADGGTLFLDEIGDLPLDLQAKLLRVLQDGTFERLGSSHKRTANVRIIAATNHDLGAMTTDGRFRADLFYRMNVFPIRLPSLRERVTDIPRLVWYIIHRRQKALQRSISHISEDVMTRLQRFDWPGNVRELQNVIERAMIHSHGDHLVLDADLGVSGGESTVAAAAVDGATLDVAQRRHIAHVLEQCHWRINGAGNAAEQLGLHPNTLRFRMKKLGLTRPTTPNTSA